MPERRWHRVAAAALALLLCAGCTGSGDAVMEAVPPPDGWEQAVLESRAEKDRDFRLDPDSPIPPERREAFDGLGYWPVDPAYRLEGPLLPYPEPEPFTIITTTGKSRPCERYAKLRFRLRGELLELQVYRLLDSSSSSPFLPFTDATSGVETYPAGRYVDLERIGENRWVLDFNRAFNPLCAYGMPERYVCPVTPPENRLPVRVEAGERGYPGAPAISGTEG